MTANCPTDTDDGAPVVHCDYYDQNTKSYCKKLKANCPRHSKFSRKRKAEAGDTEPDVRAFPRASSTNYQICGYPLPMSDPPMCVASRANCQKHQDWESIRQQLLFSDEIAIEQSKKAVAQEERVCIH